MRPIGRPRTESIFSPEKAVQLCGRRTSRTMKSVCTSGWSCEHFSGG